MNFDFKNECKNEFKGDNEKSSSWFITRVSHKIDFKAVWPRNGHADTVVVNFSFDQNISVIINLPGGMPTSDDA